MNLIKLDFDGREVRTVVRPEGTWWVLRDVCEVLGLTTPARVAERLDEDEVSLTHITDALGREQDTTIINESGLYSVILRSDKPEAKAFRKWVTSEVLPQIRKTGRYIHPSMMVSIDQICDKFRVRPESIVAAVDWSLPWHGDKVLQAVRAKNFDYRFTPEEALLIMVRLRPNISLRTMTLMLPQLEHLSIPTA